MRAVTPFYAGLLGLAFLALSLLVIRARKRARILLGHAGEPALERAVRAHGNFAEYVPLVLLLLLVAEVMGSPGAPLHLAGASLLLGRLLHALAFLRGTEDVRLRAAGMVLTFLALALAALLNLALSLA